MKALSANYLIFLGDDYRLAQTVALKI